MRQDDPIFIKLLSEIRLGKITPETKRILNSRIIPYTEISAIEPTQLYPHKCTTEEINRAKLDELLRKNPKMTFPAKDSIFCKESKTVISITPEFSKILDDRISKNTVLCVNAQVMLKANLDVASGFVNGSRGVIIKFNPGSITVLFDTGIELDIIPFEFTVETSTQIVRRLQIPLELAWACTTHKSQGSTITKVITDMSNIFCDAQGYVTLSRVKSLEGLYLIGINYAKITCNKSVIEYYNSLEKNIPYTETLIDEVEYESETEAMFSKCML